jgi:ribosomal protein S18 acetylase RimI-like enzyme
VKSELELRCAVDADLEALTQLARSSFIATFAAVNTPEDMKSYLQQAFANEVMRVEFADSNNSYIVAEIKGELAGYAKLRRDSHEPCITAERHIELERLYTATELIGRGVGAMLMQKSLEMARAERCEVLWLGVWENNTGAIRFYQREGFVDVGSHAFMLGSDRQVDRIMQFEL